jgi:glycosyltransferase involved in cell wall biosynthesis
MSLALSTVVIPIYNGALYIEDALNSILAQESLPQEIIAVDDCSTDNSVVFLHEFARNCSIPIRIVRLDRNSGGPVKPMNTGIRLANTKFVTLLDQDDRMLPNRIQDQVATLQACSSAVACIGYLARIDSDGQPIADGFVQQTIEQFNCFVDLEKCCNGIGFHLKRGNARLYAFENGSLTIASSTTIRKDLWEEAGGFDESFRIAWDMDFTLNALDKYDCVIVPKPIGEYRIHSNNSSGNQFACTVELGRVRRKWLETPGIGLNQMLVRQRVAKDAIGLSYHESARGLHARAIKNAIFGTILFPQWQSCIHCVKTILKALIPQSLRKA